MPEPWTGDIVAMLHVNQITQKELAEEMGVTHVYVSTILNGAKKPAGAEDRMKGAIESILLKRAETVKN